MTRIVAIASGKGGVGKTFLSLQLAGALAAVSKRVLLFDGDIGLEGRITHNADFKTVAGVKATVNKEVFDGVFLNGGLGFDKGSNYQAVIGTVGVKVAF